MNITLANLSGLPCYVYIVSKQKLCQGNFGDTENDVLLTYGIFTSLKLAKELRIFCNIYIIINNFNIT